MALKFLLILIILGFWFSGCKRNPAPEVRNLLKDTKIGRLDLDLFRLDTVLPDWGVLQKKYGRYWDTYTIGVLQLGRASDSNFSNLLALFLKDPVMREVADTVAIRYQRSGKTVFTSLGLLSLLFSSAHSPGSIYPYFRI